MTRQMLKCNIIINLIKVLFYFMLLFLFFIQLFIVTFFTKMWISKFLLPHIYALYSLSHCLSKTFPDINLFMLRLYNFRMLNMTRSLLSSIVSTDYVTHKLIANKKRDLRNDDNITPYQEEKVKSNDAAGTYFQPYGRGQREKYQMSEHCVNENPISRDITVPSKKNKLNEVVSGDVISAKGSCKECSLREDLLEDLLSAVGHLKIVFESNICLGKLIDS